MKKVMRDSSGFTLIELLAAVAIIAVLMMVAVPAVTEVLRDSRNRTYVEDSIRLVSTLEQQMRKDNKMPVPAVNSCIAMNLSYLDNNTFNDAPYDGEYDRLYSFAVAKRETLSNYKYYVRLVEKLPSSSGYRGVNLAEVDSLYEKNARDTKIVNLKRTELYSLTDYVTNTATLKSKLSASGINCNEIIVYAPDGEAV